MSVCRARVYMQKAVVWEVYVKWVERGGVDKMGEEIGKRETKNKLEIT